MDTDQVRSIFEAFKVKPEGSSGDIMLTNGQTLTGTWVTNLTTRTVHIQDATGKNWWVGFEHIAAFSPQPIGA